MSWAPYLELPPQGMMQVHTLDPISVACIAVSLLVA